MRQGIGGLSLAITLLAVSVGPARSQSNWTGAVSPDWFTPGNWTGMVPAAGIDAIINTTSPNPTAIEAAANATAQNLDVGPRGSGTLLIQGGGRLTNVFSAVGNFAGSQGTATVSGVASTWTNSQSILVGGQGTGNVAVQNGGTLNTSGGTVGQSSGSSGSVTVSGPGSTWNNGPGGGLNVGSFGSGTLAITGGGTVLNNTNFTANIGSSAGSNGTVTVTGTGSSWSNSQGVNVGNAGTGTLTIADGAIVNGPITIATGTGSTGTLNIGAPQGNAATAPGTLAATSLAFGAGTGTLTFNHTSGSFAFAPAVSGSGSIQALAGTTVLTGANTYSGATVIGGGTLQVGAGGTTGTLGTGPVTNNAALSFNRSDPITVTNVIGGTGSLTQVGTGVLTLAGEVSYTGSTTVSNGATVRLASPVLTSIGSTAFFVNGPSTLIVDATQREDIRGRIAFDSTGGGTVDFTGSDFNGGVVMTGSLTIATNGGAQDRVVSTTGFGLNLNFSALTLDTAGSGDNLLVSSKLWNSSGPVTKIGPGTAVMSFANTYLGATILNRGTLSVSALASGGVASNIGSSSNAANNLVYNGGTLRYTGTGSSTDRLVSVGTGGGTIEASGSGALNLTNPGAVAFNNQAGTRTLTLGGSNAGANTLAAVLGDNGGATALIKAGTGTWVLAGNEGYTGGTTIGAGTLQVGNGGASGRIVGDVANNGALVFNRADALTFNVVIHGSGSLTQAGAGTLTLTSGQTFTGLTTISAGTLQIGSSGGNSGSIAGNIVDNGALVYARSDAHSYGGVVSGTGTLTQAGGGILNLTGPNTYTGLTNVNAGVLAVNGAVAGNAQVNTGASLRGTGTVAGQVHVAGGGHLARGNSPGTLNLGSLVLDPNSQLDYELGLPGQIGGSNDLTTVAGNLTLDGTLNLSNLGGMSAGVYRLINYTGTLIDNGLAVTGSLPARFASSDFLVDAATPGQVNLIVQSGGFALQFWDGVNTTANNAVDGGTATWNTTTTNWTGAAGTVNAPWQSGFAVFHGTAGTVTLGQNIAFEGMQFRTTGYTINGAGFTLAGEPETIIRVDPLVTATINAPIVDGVNGPTRLIRDDAGLLVLGGLNTYSGGTAINGGAIQVGADSNLGASSGGLSLNNGALITSASFGSSRSVDLSIDGGSFAPAVGTTLSLTGVISGPGMLGMLGAGTLVLTAANSYAGDTFVGNGVLAVSRDANLGAPGGALFFSGGTLRLDADMSVAVTRPVTLDAPGGRIDTNGHTATFAQRIDGSGGLIKLGSGTLVLAGNNEYEGGTTIGAGTLQIGNGGTSGSIAGDVVNDSALVFSRGDALAYSGIVSGSGTLTQRGPGTLTLTGDSTYVGTTTISGGTLQIGDGGATGSIGSGPVTNDGILAFNRSGTLTVTGAISGTGSLKQSGPGTTVLTGANSYAGGTTILAGTLQLGNGGGTGSINGNVTTANDGTLAFARNNLYAFDGVISGSGGVSQIGPGTTVLSAASTYRGATTVAAGTLRAGAANAFSPNSTYTVVNGATLDTGGFNQRVASLENTGTVSLLSAAAGSTLTVTGAYVAHSLLRLGTQLGGDGSVSDRLVLDGPGASASGNTTIQITNLGGLGALTTGNGIEVVGGTNGATTTAQTTRSAFTLANGHVDAGAYEYRLYAADAQGAGENWYLRSAAPVVSPIKPGQPPVAPVQVPTFRAEVPLLAAVPAQLRQADLAMLGNLHRRIGDESSSVQSEDTQAAALSGTRRAWGRMVYADMDIQQPGVAHVRSDGHLSGLQAGTDLWASGDWRAGVYVGYLDGSSDVSGNARGIIARVGYNELQSRYLGAYATWMTSSGLYVDTVLQGGSQRFTIRPDINLGVGGKASSVAASVEVGKPFALSARWSLEPQAQIAWQRTRIDDMLLSGAQVRQDLGHGWIGRLGVRIKGNLATGAGRLEPYARLNLYWASFGDSVTTFIGPAGALAMSSGGGYSAAEAAAGATLALNPATSLYGEIGHLWSIGGAATVKSSALASLGIKVRW